MMMLVKTTFVIVASLVMTSVVTGQITLEHSLLEPNLATGELIEAIRYPAIHRTYMLDSHQYPKIAQMYIHRGNKASNPFFCRIEDAIAKQNRVNFKFRLGSIDYVDALEGKGYFKAVSYSRATNLSMQYQPPDQ